MIKSALDVNHAAIALPAHLITLNPFLPCPDGESFTGPDRRKARRMKFLRPTGWRETKYDVIAHGFVELATKLGC